MRAPIRTEDTGESPHKGPPYRAPRRKSSLYRGRWAKRGAWLLGLAVLAAATGAAWQAGFLGGEGWRALILLGLGALINLLLLAAYLHTREILGRKGEYEALCLRELRYYRLWSADEGILRKVGLIRDLNDSGIVPRELEQIVLPGADLRGIDLSGCSLRGADLREADLQGADLDGADLWGADLSGASLNLASLRGANLRGCRLRGATLLKAKLDGANLHRADLVNANLEGADLEKARLDRARFADGATGELQRAPHHSVEDWIRERLDAKGYYRKAEPAA